MNKKLVGILICMLMITTAFTTIIGDRSKAVENDENEINPNSSENILPENLTNDYWEYFKNHATFSDTGTYFYGNYDDELEWKNEGGVAEAYVTANPITGSVNTLGHAWVGEGRAEARCTVYFWIGRQKSITIKGHTISFGGTTLVPPASIASTCITMMIDNDVDKWWYEFIDHPLEIEFFLQEFFWFASILGFIGAPEDIYLMFRFVESIYAYEDLMDAINALDSEDKDEVSITRTFNNMGAGYHSASIGLRSDAVGILLGYAFAGRAGIVDYIYIDGIAPPQKPTLDGPDTGNRGIEYEFLAETMEYNSDPVQFKVDWGDGTPIEWSEYVENGVFPFKWYSHTYQDNGDYTIKVWVRDIDMMEALEYGSHTILIDSDPPVASFDCYHDFEYHIIVDASESYDPDGGDIVGYRWDWENNGVYDTGWLGGPLAGHDYGSGSTYTVKLQVKDDEGDTDETTHSIKVESNPIDPIVIESVTPTSATVEEGDTVEFTVEVSGSSGNNYYLFYGGDGGSQSGYMGYTKTISYTYSSEGTFYPDVEVHDLDENLYDASYDFAVVTVEAHNNNPLG